MKSLIENPVSSIRVKDIMQNAVISVHSSVTAIDAAKLMENAKVGSIIVIENNTPIGIITDRDFAIKVAAHAYPIDTPVKRIMSAPLISINPNESISIAYDLMSSRKICKLPVIDEDIILGIITTTDLMRYHIQEFDT